MRRAGAYLPDGVTARLQWCWTHLWRDVQALADSSDGKSEQLGHALLRPTKELFRHWSRYRDGTITRAKFGEVRQPIRRDLDALLQRCAFSRSAHLRGMSGPL